MEQKQTNKQKLKIYSKNEEQKQNIRVISLTQQTSALVKHMAKALAFVKLCFTVVRRMQNEFESSHIVWLCEE